MYKENFFITVYDFSVINDATVLRLRIFLIRVTKALFQIIQNILKFTMSVSLKIVSFKGQPFDKDEPVILGEQGGTIGRLDSCDLVLPDMDKIVSRQHASIEMENGSFVLTDRSLGGTFIDNSPAPINNSSVTLTDGMTVQIGEYQIIVNLLPDNAGDSSPFAADAFPSDSLISAESSPFDEENALLNVSDESPGLAEVPENPFTMEAAGELLTSPENEFVPSSEQSENFSTLNDSFIPPVPKSENHANDEIPEDFNFEDFFNEEKSTPVSTPDLIKSAIEPPIEPLINPQPQAIQEANSLLDNIENPMQESVVSEPESSLSEIEIPSVATDANQPVQHQPIDNNSISFLQAFLQGAGLPQLQIESTDQEDKMQRIGAMFRQFAESTVAVLRSRAEFKSLFRVTVTTIKKTDNNPLKFSVNTDEALQHLINDGQGGFKKSVDAIDEGFQDLLNHQMAMQAGIQASLQEILNQFEPGRIEKIYQEGMVLNKKAKCWDRYSEVYARLAESAIDDFYGDAFAEAYEQQMKQILAVNQNPNKE